jgi:exosortase
MNSSNPSNTSNTSNSLRLTILTLVIIVAGATLYGSSIAKLAYAVMNREGSSHGIFVPFLSVFFLWIKRETLKKTEMRYDLIGIPIMLAGLIFPIFRLGPYNLQILGFIIFLSGSVVLLLGWNFFKEISFPLLFLITLVPIPDETYAKLADSVRVISFGGARWIISLLGISFVSVGNDIQFYNITLNVAEGCSGIRYLISYFVFSFAYAYLYREKLWSRISVICSSILISLFASVMRLTSIFVMVYYISPFWGQHKPHVVISWIVFFVTLIVAVGLDQHFQNKKIN